MIELAAVIAEMLALHAEAVEKLGTEFPEQHPEIPEELRIKMGQARINVNATLEGSDPTQHVLHLQALNKGLRIVLRRLLPPAAPKPPAPPQPVWDDTQALAGPGHRLEDPYRRAGRSTSTERGPDDPNELFREGES